MFNKHMTPIGVSSMKITFVIVLFIALSIPHAEGSVECQSGLWAASCPDENPVCCYLSDGRVVGCCPQYTVCDFTTGGCASAPAPAGAPPAVTLQPITAAVSVTIPMVLTVGGVLLGLVVLCFVSYHGRSWYDAFRRRRRERIAQAELRAQEEAQRRREEEMEPAVDSDEEDMLLEQHTTTTNQGEEGEEGGNTRGGPSYDVCKVCKVEKCDCVVFPCGHFSSCYVCARHLKHCVICGDTITKRKRVFQA
eukprot:PhF_6_TR41727/c0_g1_i1/m.63312